MEEKNVTLLQDVFLLAFLVLFFIRQGKAWKQSYKVNKECPSSSPGLLR